MFLIISKFQTTTRNEVLDPYLSLNLKIKNYRDPSHDVTCMSSIIQDGEQLTFFSPNILKTKQDINNS
jgi:hypothetical protein